MLLFGSPLTNLEPIRQYYVQQSSRLPLVYQMYIVIAFLTGGRPQEILALTKNDVQVDKVTFNKSLGLRGKLQEDNMMKTPWSNRTVPIPRMYGEWLVENIKALPEGKILFHSSKSAYGYLDRDNVGCRFKKYVKDVLGNNIQHRIIYMILDIPMPPYSLLYRK